MRVAKNRRTLDEVRAPSRPDIAYPHSWIDWMNWLGARRSITSRRFAPKHFISLREWLEWVATEPFKTKQDYDDWCGEHRAERKDLGIPSSPALVYADFPGWIVALKKPENSGFRGRRPLRYVPFREAREFARSVALTARTADGWAAWARDHKRLLASYRIPAAPDRVAQYRQEFRGWRDFLGADRRPTPNRKR